MTKYLGYDSSAREGYVSTVVTLPILYTATLVMPVNAAFVAATNSGTIVAGSQFYRVSALSDYGETFASTETNVHLAATGNVTVKWATVTNAVGYKVYGRAKAAEKFIVQVAATLQYLDTGSITPDGALPSADTSWGKNLTEGAVMPCDHNLLYMDVPTLAASCTFTVYETFPGAASSAFVDYDVDKVAYPRSSYKGGDILKFLVTPGAGINAALTFITKTDTSAISVRSSRR